MTEKDFKAFYYTNEAWYFNNTNILQDGDLHEMLIGIYGPCGGTSGEFMIRWKNLCGSSVPYLHAFSDSWKILHNDFLFLIEYLAEHDGEHITPKDIMNFLLENGVRDITKRTNQNEV